MKYVFEKENNREEIQWISWVFLPPGVLPDFNDERILRIIFDFVKRKMSVLKKNCKIF